MTTENDNNRFDAGKFYEEGLKNVGLMDEPQTAPKTEDVPASDVIKEQKEEIPKVEPKAEDIKAALDSIKEPEVKQDTKPVEPPKPVKSVIAGLLPKVPKSEQRVPLEDHIKLRQKKQEEERLRLEVERERDELRAKLATFTDTVKSGQEESPLEKFVKENPDEDIVPAKIQLEERNWQREQNRKADASRQEEQRSRESENIVAAINNRALLTEVEFRKTHPDYDIITDAITNPKLNLISEPERIAILQTENPAQELYELCKAKTAAFRSIYSQLSSEKQPVIEPAKQTPAAQIKDENAPMSEEDFEASFKK